LKGSYRLLVFAPKEWQVISSCYHLGAWEMNDKRTEMAKEEFRLESDIHKDFGHQDGVRCFMFEESPKLSTYLYSVIAGPYKEYTNPHEFIVPLRIYCRQSMAKYLKPDEHFYVTAKGIEFYSDFFSCPYPFSKLDQIYCGEYNMGAMENVGAIIYNDDYIPREEKRARPQEENTMNTVLHELSHMWFGNMVTMKWWDDLWLNESFANFISYLCLDRAKGLENYNYSWSNFLDERVWAMNTDQMSTTHPISTVCKHTDEANELFDGISYGKGACFLKQLFYYFGESVMRLGLKNYFAKYKFKNTSYQDFINELRDAAKFLDVPEDLEKWASSWVKKSGINKIWIDYEVSDDGKLRNFRLI